MDVLVIGPYLLLKTENESATQNRTVLSATS